MVKEFYLSLGIKYIIFFQEIWYRYLGDKIKNELRNERMIPLFLREKERMQMGIKCSKTEGCCPERYCELGTSLSRWGR
jgi:hypothetical protein